MHADPRRLRWLVWAAALLAIAVSPLAVLLPSPGPVRAASGDVRYASTVHGYALLIPQQLQRIPGVRWTPNGPAADITIMTPDHQAALGVMVAPTGSKVFSDSELQGVAARLIAQEHGTPLLIYKKDLPASEYGQTKRVVVNGLPFQVDTVLLVGGSIPTFSSLTVAVTQRNHRLFVFASLVYIAIAHTPPAGLSPTPTPDAILGLLGRAASHTMPVNDIGPAAALPARVIMSPSSLRPVDALRGNPCPQSTDNGLTFFDKNCAAASEGALLLQVFSSVTIQAQAPDDGYAAPAVNVDGFARLVDPAAGSTVWYPAQWSAVAGSGTARVFQSADQNAQVSVAEQASSDPMLSDAAMRALASGQIAAVGNALGVIGYQSGQLNGVPYTIAAAPGVTVAFRSGDYGQAQVVVLVASYHHRVYIVRGSAITVRGLAFTYGVSVYPYFSTFTNLARRYATSTDSARIEAGLATQAAVSLFVDPRVPDAA